MKNLTGVTDNKDIATKEYVDGMVLTPLIGTTANTTPTQVATALATGRNIEITHTDIDYGDIIAYSFNYAEDVGMIASNVIITVFGALILAKLVGNTNNNTWNFETLGLAQYNDIPTKTSDLTNDSGFVTTDENLKTTALSVGNSMYLIGGSSSESTGTKLTDGALQYTRYLNGRCWLSIGKTSTEGILRLFNAKSNSVYTTLRPNADITTSNTIYLPGSDGTLALISDIPPTPLIPTDLSDLNNDLNVSDFPNDAGYITGYTETDPIFTASAAHGISASDITNWNSKQAALVSGTNIKTINSQSLLGSGNIQISGSGTSTPTADTVAEFDSSAHMKSTDMTAAEITSFVNSLNVTGIHAVDYIIEEGTSDNSSYRKWNSGIAECWVRTQQNVAINLSYGSLYQGTWTWTFPITFIENPTVTCSRFKWGSGASWGTVSTETTTGASLRGIDTSSRASGSTIISAYAIGKWK